MIQYRIEWMYLPTDYRSHGGWLNNIDETTIEILNEIHRGIIRHWIVSIDI